MKFITEAKTVEQLFLNIERQMEDKNLRIVEQVFGFKNMKLRVVPQTGGKRYFEVTGRGIKIDMFVRGLSASSLMLGNHSVVFRASERHISATTFNMDIKFPAIITVPNMLKILKERLVWV